MLTISALSIFVVSLVFFILYFLDIEFNLAPKGFLILAIALAQFIFRIPERAIADDISRKPYVGYEIDLFVVLTIPIMIFQKYLCSYSSCTVLQARFTRTDVGKR